MRAKTPWLLFTVMSPLPTWQKAWQIVGPHGEAGWVDEWVDEKEIRRKV